MCEVMRTPRGVNDRGEQSARIWPFKLHIHRIRSRIIQPLIRTSYITTQVGPDHILKHSQSQNITQSTVPYYGHMRG
ncbi:hypothetical protein AALO_G00005190 [Alosa alosa]|uniref:Uncharacterized protein n=1 Tax=Alosa alosa TaxID=278164 RepID=A0AAV6HJ67_9TELE|nr:hypothetical protein AALO_G00005190 [Alosa alosa]